MRQLARRKKVPVEYHLNVPDLDLFRNESTRRNTIHYEKRLITFDTETVGEARVHERGALLAEFETIAGREVEDHRHLLVCLNARWFAVLQRGDWFLYNCHPSPRGPGAEFCSRDSAALVRFKTRQELVDAILHFGAIGANYKGWCSIYALRMNLGQDLL